MSRTSPVVRDLVLLLGLPFTLMVGLLVGWPSRDAGKPPTGGDLFAAVAGRWTATGDPARCPTSWHEIRFDDAGDRMVITDPTGRRDEYLIQGHEPDRVITTLTGDSTRDDEGVQVVWLLITTSDTSYVWRRRDWIAGHTTEPSYRCSASHTAAVIIDR